jgi:hypothetical protein
MASYMKHSRGTNRLVGFDNGSVSVVAVNGNINMISKAESLESQVITITLCVRHVEKILLVGSLAILWSWGCFLGLTSVAAEGVSSETTTSIRRNEIDEFCMVSWLLHILYNPLSDRIRVDGKAI